MSYNVVERKISQSDWKTFHIFLLYRRCIADSASIKITRTDDDVSEREEEKDLNEQIENNAAVFERWGKEEEKLSLPAWVKNWASDKSDCYCCRFSSEHFLCVHIFEFLLIFRIVIVSEKKIAF
jgi:hypothetical protein